MPVQVQGEVLSVRKVGAYQEMTVLAPDMAETYKPGHFVAVQVGGPESSMLLRRHGVTCTVVGKHSEGTGDDVVPLLLSGDVDLVIKTPWGVGPRLDGYEIRAAAVARGVPCITTIQGAAACVQGIEALVAGGFGVRSLQEHHTALRASAVRQRAAAAGPGGRTA